MCSRMDAVRASPGCGPTKPVVVINDQLGAGISTEGVMRSDAVAGDGEGVRDAHPAAW